MERSTPTAVRAFLVDRNDLFRRGLRQILEDHAFDVVGDTADAASALEQALFHRPDVVVLDPDLPHVAGVELLADLAEQLPRTRSLVLTTPGDDDEVLDAFAAGAAGYVLKDASLADIVAGVRTTARGESPLSPSVAATLLRSLRGLWLRIPRRPVPELSPRERDVLALLVAGHDNDEIARLLFLSPSTVKNHVSHILPKLGAENRTQAAVRAVVRGLVMI